ncbi:phosphate ABC transporter permease PstA [Ureaplasma zalophigenitalium]|uniref:Phosphate transport system permease protein PstA n=1 Tax=Ureaplasma zalophigenitalium TaxID=907723 RepID=A0ABT3BQ41_9BACT|nr:phosphate ABC transporter permease PstA [Ureaplasma zalophigenitalium]MCV3754242.1 phosphate ABC transporter permease PstA [Ureaplasma zalophigenitalium]
MIHRSRLKNKRITDNVFKHFSFLFILFFIILFIAILAFIIAKAIPGFQHYGLKRILFSNDFNLHNTKKQTGVSVWLPLAVTLMVSFGALLIAAPIGIKTATFIKFRLKSEVTRKVLKVIILSLSGIPSVIFGLFTINSLGPVLKVIFHTQTVMNIFTTFVMLSFIILPTIIATTLNAYDAVDPQLIENGIGMGSSYTRSLYKTFKAEAKANITIGLILALGRAIGETMAVSMILSDEGYNNVMSQGLKHFLNSSLRPLGALISTNMFGENVGENLKGLLYVFGIVLFIVVMILNAIVLYLTSQNSNKSRHVLWIRFTKRINNCLNIIPNYIKSLFERLSYKNKYKVSPENIENVNAYVTYRIQHHKLIKVYDYYKIFCEVIASIIAFGFLFWISLDIIVNGVITFVDPTFESTVFKYTKNTTGQAVINTLLIIFLALLIAFPIALFSAIYLNEYAKNKRFKKVIYFFIDSFGSTPSILFGMFGLVIFIEWFGWTASGAKGTSLLVGALTIALVILPMLIRSIQQALQAVPKEVRINAYGLGSSKWQTIRKLVLPQAMNNIISGIFLSMGRIIAETAPLYLTAGLTSSKHIGLLSSGQTLTTRIYANAIMATDLKQARYVQYEAAFVTLWIVLFLIIMGYIFVPYLKDVKSHLKQWFKKQIGYYHSTQVDHLEIFQSQIYKKFLLITYEQAALMNYNIKLVKYAKIRNRIYEIRYIDEKAMEQLI